MAKLVGAGPVTLSQERFAELLGESLAPASRVAARYVVAAEVQDAIQNAALAAWRARGTFDSDRGSFRAWWLTIVAREAQRVSRDAARRRDLAVVLAGLRIEPPIPDRDRAVDVAAAMGALTERQQQVVGLHYLADLPVATVATLLEVSEGTVKSTLHAARARLRAALTNRGGDHG